MIIIFWFIETVFIKELLSLFQIFYFVIRPTFIATCIKISFDLLFCIKCLTALIQQLHFNRIVPILVLYTNCHQSNFECSVIVLQFNNGLLNALLNCSTSNITLYLFLFTVVLVLVSDSTSSTIEVITTVFLLNTLLIGNTVADFLTLFNVCLNLFNFSRSIWLPSCCNYSIVRSAPHTPYLNYLNWMLIQFHLMVV